MVTGISADHFWEDKKVLVTGGAGFIGAEIVRQLVQNKTKSITILDKLTYAADMERLKGFEDDFVLEQVALEDQGAVEAIIGNTNPDIIIHSAAESHVDRSIDGPEVFIQSNIIGTYSLLQSALKHWRGKGKPDSFRFLHISTDEVYGSLGATGAFSDESSYDPRSPYSASKAASDHLAKAWWHTYGLPTITTNCGNNYGPWQFPEKLIPLMIASAMDHKELPLYGSGDQVREWIHVSDHVNALLLAVEKGNVGETYLIGSGDERSNKSVVEGICEYLDNVLPQASSYLDLMVHVQDRPGHDKRYALDATKFQRETGWSAQYGFEQGLRLTIDWYIGNNYWWRKIQDEKYAGKRLGVSA